MQSRSCSGLAYSTLVVRDDGEVSSNVLTDQRPDAAAKLNGKGINVLCHGC